MDKNPKALEIKKINHLISSDIYTNFDAYIGNIDALLYVFEVSRVLRDIDFEKQAFELLKRALTERSKQVNFENGIIGTGFTLLYLIENKFLDIDFEKLFTKQGEIIVNSLNRQSINLGESKIDIRTLYFLYLAYKITHKKYYHLCLENLTNKIEIYLSSALIKCDHLNNTEDKSAIIDLLQIYMHFKVVVVNNSPPLEHLLDLFVESYYQGIFMSNFKIGYFLSKLLKRQNNEFSIKKVSIMADNALLNICYTTLSLSEKIDMLFYLKLCPNKNEILAEKLENELCSLNSHLLQTKLIHISKKDVVKLLLFQIFLYYKKECFEVERFSLIF